MPARLRRLESELLTQLQNHRPEFLTASTASSTRAAGDAIQTIVCDELPELVRDITGLWAEDLSRRAMADARFRTEDGTVYEIDVKTHRTDTSFSMPHLISFHRLADFYEDPKNMFLVVLVSYSVLGNAATFSSCRVFPIEWLAWESLTLANLGKGQIQIKNTRKLSVIDNQDRAAWMVELCDRVLSFYEREAGKLLTRGEKFRQLRDRWAVRQ